MVIIAAVSTNHMTLYQGFAALTTGMSLFFFIDTPTPAFFFF